MTITKRTNLAEIMDINGCGFIGIDVVTEVKVTKTIPDGDDANGKPVRCENPDFGKAIYKVSNDNTCMVMQNKNGSAYESMVNRRLIKEGFDKPEFKVQPRTWGERIPETPFIKHTKDGKTKYYLEVIYQKSGDSYYTVDGKTTAKEDIHGLSKSVMNAKSQGGVNDKVVIRTIGIDSLNAVRINGEEYTNLYFKEL